MHFFMCSLDMKLDNFNVIVGLFNSQIVTRKKVVEQGK